MNQFFFSIFFLILNCQAISVSQLERLKKARKDVTIALHEYNDVINQNMAQITVWKKKIEDFVKIIASIDPDGAKKLQETMIEPTLQAVDRVVKQREAGQSLLFKSKGMPEEILESKVIEPKKPIEQKSFQLPTKEEAINNEIERLISLYRQSDDWYNVFEDKLAMIDQKSAAEYRAQVPKKSQIRPDSEIQQTVSKKNVAQKPKKDLVQKEKQKKEVAIVPVEHQILTQSVKVTTPDLPVLQSVSTVPVIAQQPTQFPFLTIEKEPVVQIEPQKVIITPVKSVQLTQPTISVEPVASTIQRPLLPTESHKQAIEPPVQQLQEPKTEEKVVQGNIKSLSQLPESQEIVTAPIKEKKVTSKELIVLPGESVSKVPAIAQQPTQFPVLTIEKEPIHIEKPQNVIITPVKSVQSSQPTISVEPVASTPQEPLLPTEFHEQTIEPPVEQLQEPETEEKVVQSSLESPSQLPKSQEIVTAPIKEKKVTPTIPKLSLKKAKQPKREKQPSKSFSDPKAVTKKGTPRPKPKVLKTISQTSKPPQLSLISEEQEGDIVEVPSKPKTEPVPLAAEESNVDTTGKKAEPAISEVPSKNTTETVPAIVESAEDIDDSIFDINSV